jgi:hypothetical protein
MRRSLQIWVTRRKDGAFAEERVRRTKKWEVEKEKTKG